MLSGICGERELMQYGERKERSARAEGGLRRTPLEMKEERGEMKRIEGGGISEFADTHPVNLVFVVKCH